MLPSGASRYALPGARLHFQHGPIDLIIDARGDAATVRAAHQAAWARFQGILAELVAELPALRTAAGETCPVSGPVARAMWQAVHPFREVFITPMAAVAGAVAQDIAACYARAGVARAIVNNGGDIALVLSEGEAVRVGIVSDAHAAAATGLVQPDGTLHIAAAMPVRGIATSGWQGRSFSLGIADSVTVLAATAAQADAAATIVANAVNLERPDIVRRPARELQPDSDLGERLVTVAVPALSLEEAAQALRAGQAVARQLVARGLIQGAVLACQGAMCIAKMDPLKGMPEFQTPGTRLAQG